MAAVTMYSTTWCGYCRRLKVQLDQEGIEYTEIDIEQHPGAAELVERINGGSRIVPTVVTYPPGSSAPIALVNPSLAQVKEALRQRV